MIKNLLNSFFSTKRRRKSTSPSPTLTDKNGKNNIQDPTIKLQQYANATQIEKQTIQEAIKAAQLEISQATDVSANQNHPSSQDVTPLLSPASKKNPIPLTKERADLIQRTLMVFKQKQPVLAYLNPSARKKLRIMAQALLLQRLDP